MTTFHRRTILTALALAAGVAMVLGPPATARTRADPGSRPALASQVAPVPTDPGEMIAFRKAQQARYLVDHGLLGLR